MENTGRMIGQVLAVIPAFNEATQIAGVVSQALEYLPVLVVDDGSTDETAHQAELAGAQVLHQASNQGKGVALRAGFRYALDQDWEAVLTLDGDGQHDPVEIPKFLQIYLDRKADLIIGMRDFGKMPIIRRFSNSFGRLSFSWAAGLDIPDNQSGYRLVSRRLMEALLASQERGFEFEVEMILTCIRSGYSMEWVPISTIYAGEKSHIRAWSHSFNYLRMLWRARRHRKLKASTEG